MKEFCDCGCAMSEHEDGHGKCGRCHCFMYMPKSISPKRPTAQLNRSDTDGQPETPSGYSGNNVAVQGGAEDGWCEICGAGAIESGMYRCEKHKEQQPAEKTK